MWTKRDRVLAVLSGERPDRVPIFECVAHDGILEHFGGNGPIRAGDSEAVIRACSRFLDLCHPALLPQEPKRVEHAGVVTQEVERWSTWTLPPAVVDEPEMLRTLQREIEAAEAWVPEKTVPAAFRQTIEKNNAFAGDMVYIHVGLSCPVLPFDIEQGIYLYADHPELVKRWNRAQNELGLRRMADLARADIGPVCICWDDIAFKGRLLYPPSLLEELFYPHLAAQMDLFHSRGVKVLFHSDGDVTAALPRLLDCGIDGFNPLEISAGMDVRAFHDICGRRVALVGGIDAVDVLAFGTPELVAERTRQLIDLFREDGNLMVASASGEIDDSMPTENVLAMFETVWNYGKY